MASPDILKGDTFTVTETLTMAAEPKTKTIRAHADIVTMLKAIELAADLTGEKFKAVQFCDELLRPGVTARYKKAMAIITKTDPTGGRGAGRG